MKKTRITILLALLITISLGTLGFSVRITTGDYFINEKIDTTIGNIVLQDGNGVRIINIKSFELGKDGIISDEQIVESGDVVVEFSLDLKKLRNSHFIKDDNFCLIAVSIQSGEASFIEKISGVRCSLANMEINKNENTGRVYKTLIKILVNATENIFNGSVAFTFTGDMTPFFNVNLNTIIAIEAVNL